MGKKPKKMNEQEIISTYAPSISDDMTSSLVENVEKQRAQEIAGVYDYYKDLPMDNAYNKSLVEVTIKEINDRYDRQIAEIHSKYDQSVKIVLGGSK